MQSENIRDMFFLIFGVVICIAGYIMGEIIRRKFNTGDFVFAKMRFFPPWPAQVEEIEENRARVRFLGDGNQW